MEVNCRILLLCIAAGVVALCSAVLTIFSNVGMPQLDGRQGSRPQEHSGLQLQVRQRLGGGGVNLTQLVGVRDRLDSLIQSQARLEAEVEKVQEDLAALPTKVRATFMESRTTTTTTIDFVKTYQCREEPWINAIFANFSQRGGANYTRVIEKAYNDPGCGLRFEIRQGKLIWKHNPDPVDWWPAHEERGAAIARMLEELLAEGPGLPDMVFAIQPGDGASTLHMGEGSGLMRTEGKLDKDLLWLPRSLFDWGKKAAQELEAVPCPPEYKKNVAVFRGSPTGGCRSWDENVGLQRDGSVLPRYTVVKLSKDRPDLLDARFTDAPDDCWPNELRARGMIGRSLNYAAQSCYAAVVVPYGNSVADRLVQQFARGVPVIFMRGRDDVDEFWYNEVVNGTHWIEATPENLREVLEWALRDNELLQRIGQNAKTFVKERLSKRRLMCYVFRLLSEYGRAYKEQLG